MSQLLDSPFEKLLAKLVRDYVRFVTVGGVAVAMNGFVRSTEDVDILIDPSPANIDTTLTSLRTFGQGFARELSRDDFTDEEGCIRISEESESCQIDIFTRIGGLTWKDMESHIRHFEVSGVRIPYLSRAGLVMLKRESHREKDRIDVDALERLDAGESVG